MTVSRHFDLSVEHPDREGASASSGPVVGDVMTRNPLLLDADLPMHTAAVLLHDLQLSGAPVVDGDGELVGVFSQRELLDRLLVPALAAQDPRAIRRWWSVRVGDECSSPARCTTPETSIAAAAGEMLRHKVGRLVVVDGAEIVGLITQRDVLEALHDADAHDGGHAG